MERGENTSACLRRAAGGAGMPAGKPSPSLIQFFGRITASSEKSEIFGSAVESFSTSLNICQPVSVAVKKLLDTVSKIECSKFHTITFGGSAFSARSTLLIDIRD
jgi:hypothetical protein